MTDLSKLAKKLNEATSIEEAITIVNGEVQLGAETAQQYVRHDRERPIRNRRLYKKGTIEEKNDIFPTIAVLVSVRRDWEYELWLLTENLTKWSQEEPERSWDISYIKSMPREFTGTPWYAWGYPGFLSKGVFSGAEYGFIDTIPTVGELGIPVLLETKTLDVSQQLGISTPLFWDEGNPAPVTKVNVEFTLTNAWFSGVFRDNYVEITHAYKDRYENVSIASTKGILNENDNIVSLPDTPPIFPDDWWVIYPYPNDDVDIEHKSFPLTKDIYRYAYSPSGEGIDFNSLSPGDYVTVKINRWEEMLDPIPMPLINTGINDVPVPLGEPILNTNRVFTGSSSSIEDEWHNAKDRLGNETCEEPEGGCVAETQIIDSEQRDFGFAFSWNIGCFKEGTLNVVNEENIEASIAVDKMPVNIAWDEVPAKLLITGVPDQQKNSPGNLESGKPVVFEFDAPYEYSLRLEPEIQFKWRSGPWKEVNASIYGLAYQLQGNTGRWKLTGNKWTPGGGNGGYFERYLSFAPGSSGTSGGFWANNYGLNAMSYFELVPGGVTGFDSTTGAGIDGSSTMVALNPSSVTYFPPVYIPYISLLVDGSVVIDYGTVSDLSLSGGVTYHIDIVSSSDTVVTVNGTEYWFAGNVTIVETPTQQLTVFEDGIEVYQGVFEERYPVRLEGVQNIAQYKNYINTASIQFLKNVGGKEVVVSYSKPGVGTIEGEYVIGDCNDRGLFVYDHREVKGYLGFTKVRENGSDGGWAVLYHWIYPRENGDEVLENEVEPEISLTFVYAGGKVYSGVHTKNILNRWVKRVANSPNNQYAALSGLEPVSIQDSLIDRYVVSPLENVNAPKWGLDDIPPPTHQKAFLSDIPGIEETGVGYTLQWIGTKDSEPENVGESVWRSSWEGAPIDYATTEPIKEGAGLQWSNHHEYFVPRKREYRRGRVSDQSDTGVWLGDWSPINTVGLTGILPSGEFRSLSLYSETTPVKLTFGIKGVLDTVQGANNEPLHFVFTYGAHYAVFGKVNNGLDEDENIAILKTAASDDTALLFVNKQLQTQSTPPRPATHSYNSLMKQSNYSWGGFRNYITPYTPGGFNEVHSINKQLPELMFTFPTTINTSGIESTYAIGVRYIDPDETYTITIAGQTIEKTGFSSASTLANSFQASIQSVVPSGTIVSNDGQSIFITTTSTVSVSPEGGLTGIEVLIETDDEITAPGETQPSLTYRLVLPGINAPYRLIVDGLTVNLPVSNGQSKDAALQAIQGVFPESEINDDRVEIKGVFLVERVEVKDFNDIFITQSVVATESTDITWREDEIKWDVTPTCGTPETNILDSSSVANVSENLKYDRFDYSVYPYVKIDKTKNQSLFGIKDPELLDIEQPLGLLDNDFIEESALIIDYSKDGGTESWKEIPLSVKRIKSSWFATERDKINIIAIAPSVIECKEATILNSKILGEPNYE